MLYGRVAQEGPTEWRLTIYSRQRSQRRVLAVVIGSMAYIQLALGAAGLGRLTEDRSWRESALIRSKPAHRHSKRSR